MLSADLFRDRRSQLAKVVLLMCGFYFALAFAGQAWKAKSLQEMLEAEQVKLDSQEASNARLRERLEFLEGPGYEAYVERTARQQLGMVEPGDVPLFVVPDPNAPSVEPEAPLRPGTVAPPAPPEEAPVWRQWVSVFFP